MNSIRKRFVFSAGANAVRAIISLAVGMLVARGLGPADYGNLAYLLGSFWAIRALLDLRASSAFYTFISQQGRTNYYYVAYFSWLAFQFIFSLALVALILPAELIAEFWVGLDRELILLALLATFLQNQVWLTVVQMHESVRLTTRVQMVSVLIVLVHMILVAAMLLGDWLTVYSVLWAIAVEYFFAAAWFSATLHKAYASGKSEPIPHGHTEEKFRTVLLAYVRYCRPMAVIAVVSFIYEFAVRWLVQRYGGSTQQGFYQVAAQLSAVSLLASVSILNIFWKEIAEANARGARERVAYLYRKATQSLLFLAALVSCFFAPWAETLVDAMLGAPYHEAWPILLLMLFYPIHQSVGQINATMFMATGQNSMYMKITIMGLLFSILISYVLIAPGTEWAGIGLGMGAMGLALSTVGVNFLFVNFQSWVISRYYSIAFQWLEQLSAVFILLLIGYMSKFLVLQLKGLIQPSSEFFRHIPIILDLVLAGGAYLAAVIIVVIRLPQLLGMQREELSGYLRKLSGAAR